MQQEVLKFSNVCMSWRSTKTNLVTNFLNPKLDEVIYVCENLAQYIEKSLMRLSAVSAKSLTTLKYLQFIFFNMDVMDLYLMSFFLTRFIYCVCKNLKNMFTCFLQHGYYESIFSPFSGSFLKVDQKVL